MPFAPEVDTFNAEVGRDQGFVIAGNANHRAIISNAMQDTRAGARAAAYAVNQKLFGEWQGMTNILLLSRCELPHSSQNRA